MEPAIRILEGSTIKTFQILIDVRRSPVNLPDHRTRSREPGASFVFRAGGVEPVLKETLASAVPDVQRPAGFLRSGIGYFSFELIQLGFEGFDLALTRLEQFPEQFVFLPILLHFGLEAEQGLRQRRR